MSGSAAPANRIFSAGAVAAVNAKVQGIEDEFQASLDLSGLALDTARLPQRPGYGKNGRPFVAWANYVELELNPNQPLLRKYSIETKPKVTGRKLHRVIRLMLNEPPFATVESFTDFKATLICRQRRPDLAPDPIFIDQYTFNILHFPEDEDEPTEKSTVYHVHIQRTDNLNVTDLLRHIDPRNGFFYPDQVLMLHVLNTMLYQQSRSNPTCVAVGKKTFPLSGPAAKIVDLKSGLLALRGFFASVRLGTNRVLVNVNVTYNVFYKPGWLHDLINEFGHQDKRKLGTFLKFLRVKKTHLQKKRKGGTNDAPTATIWGLATPEDGTIDAEGQILPNPPTVRSVGAGPKDVRFWDGEARTYISVYDYFQKRYGIAIQHVDLPVVNVGSSQRPIYVPAEVCHVLNGQHASMRKVTLTGEQTTIMLNMAVKRPAENFQLIMDHGLTVTGLRQAVGFVDGRFAKISPQLLTVNARVRNAPKLKCAKPIPIKEATWNLQGHAFNKPGQQVQSWRWLLFNVTGCPPVILSSTAMQDMQASSGTLRTALAATGMTIAAPQNGLKFTLKSESDVSLEQCLRTGSEGVDLLWIIVPQKVKLLYDRIKHITDVRIGVTNFVSRDVKIAGPNAARGLPQYFGNEALKINLKLGGRNQLVEPGRTYFVQGGTMVVGIDVTHPSTDQTRGGAPSVAAMVASVDQHLATWFAEISVQVKRQERVQDLDKMIKSRLAVWKARNGSYPQRILIYRDGVSEGQFDMVKNDEKPLLDRAVKELYQAANQSRPSMAIIVVAKRHHTRFAPSNSSCADRTSNCPAGTVVDRGITSPILWQFFLQPHSSIQGSARPGFYTVVVDEIFRSAARDPRAGGIGAADMCEDLTQSLCYIFGRADRAVGIVTPAYYADIVCTRAACYLNAIAASDLVQGYAQAHRGSSEISVEHRNRLQAQVETHKKLKETMFFI